LSLTWEGGADASVVLVALSRAPALYGRLAVAVGSASVGLSRPAYTAGV